MSFLVCVSARRSRRDGAGASWECLAGCWGKSVRPHQRRTLLSAGELRLLGAAPMGQAVAGPLGGATAEGDAENHSAATRWVPCPHDGETGGNGERLVALKPSMNKVFMLQSS